MVPFQGQGSHLREQTDGTRGLRKALLAGGNEAQLFSELHVHREKEFGMRRLGLQTTKCHILLGVGKRNERGSIGGGEQREGQSPYSKGKHKRKLLS